MAQRDRVTIEAACWRDASYVVANMREQDAVETLCQVPEGLRRSEIAYYLLMGSDSFVAYWDSEPVMFLGTSPMNVACLSIWAIGTKLTWRVLHEMTKFVIDIHLPARLDEGFCTMEARSHVDHHQAHDWMRSTGAVVNGEPFVYGREREKFLMFRWTPEAFEVAGTRYRTSNHDNDAR